MDTIIEDNINYQEELQIEARSFSFRSEDGDSKMTLAVMSDENSKDSPKYENKMGKRYSRSSKGSFEKGDEELKSMCEDESNAKVSPKESSGKKHSTDVWSTSAKRKQSQIELSSDDEELYGFNEETGEAVMGNPHKRIKEEVESEEESIPKDKDEVGEKNLLEKPQSSVKEEIEEGAEEGEEGKSLDMEPIIQVKQSTETESEKISSTSSSKKSVKNSIYRKPFDMGWKREIVLRATPGSKDRGEVYYITPNGKKLRTRHEIQQHITPGLTLDNFTFSKDAIGMGPDEEVIRNAKPIQRSTTTDVSLGKRVPKPKAPKGASPPPQGWTATKAVKSSNIQLSRTTPTSRVNEDVEVKNANKSTPKSSKSSKKNSTASETVSTPSLQTGDDLPSRKRISNVRNKFSTDLSTPQPSTSLRSYSESFAANFFSNVSIGYDILLHIFQYLKVQELLRAACVCRVWYIVANHRSLWKTVRMKNSQVNDWSGLAATLRRNETKHLDLRKMLISSTIADEMWTSFSSSIQTVVTLEAIDLCRCSSKIVESLFVTNPNLKMLNAVTIKDDTLNLENLCHLENIEELRLKAIDGCILDGDSLSLDGLKNLKHLSLTSFRDLGSKEIEVIGELNCLESLELGECSEFDIKFATNVLPKLINLERLRLEKGQGKCCTLHILEAVSKLDKLIQLELVNFDIKAEFDDKLAQCKNIKRLLLIPTYISQSATTNNIVLSAVLRLTDTLQTLTWAVTLELLRVTALYVDQWDNKKKDKKFFDESIPVLKPVPGIPDDRERAPRDPADVPQVEILPLVKVEKILTQGMPTTKFKILKVPYHATWRQNLVDLQ